MPFAGPRTQNLCSPAECSLGSIFRNLELAPQRICGHKSEANARKKCIAHTDRWWPTVGKWTQRPRQLKNTATTAAAATYHVPCPLSTPSTSMCLVCLSVCLPVCVLATSSVFCERQPNYEHTQSSATRGAQGEMGGLEGGLGSSKIIGWLNAFLYK